MAGEMNFNLLNPNAPTEAALAPIKGMAAVNALQAQQLQNDADQMAMRNALAEQEAYKQAGGDVTAAQRNLMGAGLGKQAAALGKSVAETQQAQMKAMAERLPIQRDMAKDMAFNPSDQNIQAHLQDQVIKGWITPQEAQMRWQRVAGMNPQQREQFFLQGATKAEDVMQQQLRQAERQRGTVPAGYRMNAGGTLEAIPGGPTTTDIAPKDIQKRNEKFPAAQAAYKTFEKDSSNLIDNLKALRDHKGLSGILGTVYGRTPSITADSQAAQQLYDQILSQGQFNTLSALRQASPTGGALGNVSDRENQALRQAFGALGRVQSESDFKAAVDRVIKNIEGSQSIIKEAFDETYSYKNAAPAAGGNGKGNQKWQSALTDFENQGGGRK